MLVNLAGIHPHRGCWKEILKPAAQHLDALQPSFPGALAIRSPSRLFSCREIAQLGSALVAGQNVVDLVHPLAERESQSAGCRFLGKGDGSPRTVALAFGG